MAARLPAPARRTQLLEVALEAFAEHGYHLTSMNQVAEAAGVTKPVLYQHFRSKKALYQELLDEVATGKITGEEDRYSHTDLWDFKANVEGSQAAVAALRPVIDEKDPALGPQLDQRFAEVDKLLEGYRSGDGFKLYTELKPEDTKKMSAAVDALGEPETLLTGSPSASTAADIFLVSSGVSSV